MTMQWTAQVKWSQYLSNEDIKTIDDFVHDTFHNIKRDKILVFYGQGGNGKTTLVKEICDVIEDSAIFDPATQYDILIRGPLLVGEAHEAVNMNLLKYLLSRDTVNVLLCTNDISIFSQYPEIIDRLEVITFTHKF